MPTSTIETSPSPSSPLSSIVIRMMYRLCSVGTGLITIFAVVLYAKQESLLYFPSIGGIPRRPASNPRRYRSPSEYDIPFETHVIKCDDGVSIHSWLLLQPDSKAERRPTILFFHGNAGNIGLRLPNAHQMFTQLNANILMVEYRGYGDSDSVKPNEKGLKLDAEAALRFISKHPQIDPHRIFCFGRSLGGAVAFHLAKYAEENQSMNSSTSAMNNDVAVDNGYGGEIPQIAGFIVENTFLSISSMVDQLMPMIAPLKFLVLRMDWSNEKIAPIVSTPVLYLAGDKDELVPHSHMLGLYKMSKKVSSHAQMHVIRGGTHNDSWMVGGREYFEKTRAFMSAVMINEDTGVSTNTSTRTPIDTNTATANSKQGSSNNLFRRATLNSASNDQQDKHQPVEVTMGEDGITTTSGMNAIPIMPGNLVGMAKEASKNNAVSPDNKKKMY